MAARERFELLLTPSVYQTAWRYACYLTARREDAEDVLQEALTHAYLRFHQLRNLENFRGWLLSIIRTKFIASYRKARRTPAPVDLPNTLADDHGEPLLEALQQVLKRLSASQQEVLVLYYLEGLNITEAALVVGCKPNALKQRLWRARGALERLLEPHFAQSDMVALL